MLLSLPAKTFTHCNPSCETAQSAAASIKIHVPPFSINFAYGKLTFFFQPACVFLWIVVLGYSMADNVFRLGREYNSVKLEFRPPCLMAAFSREE